MKERPFLDFKPLAELRIENGVVLMDIYSSDKQAQSFVNAIAEQLRVETRNKMDLSPFFLFSVTPAQTQER